MKAIIEKKTVNKPYSSIEDLNGKMVEKNHHHLLFRSTHIQEFFSFTREITSIDSVGEHSNLVLI